ncbi:unnamed protein product [Vicia faba]|uniref:Uncharacterized protein n=1 Tax=Vicia faba TaxID=3906 RepID=A0AAV0YK48_VICFA|nr:unnamed protein product [Vicia faba]CAI8585144.1 unnamed protein product [Vicia faba]CAI8591873.1 unnamed protein product [Vicia faba]CAI8614671.1 unnamed protein product [Vicia faba]
MNGAKRSAEAVGCKNESVGERSALERSTRASRVGRSGSENVGLSNENIGPKIRPKGVVDGQQVNIPVLPLVGPEGRRRLGKARTTYNKRVPVPETDTGKPATEAPVNGGRNYNGPKVAKFLVG